MSNTIRWYATDYTVTFTEQVPDAGVRSVANGVT